MNEMSFLFQLQLVNNAFLSTISMGKNKNCECSDFILNSVPVEQRLVFVYLPPAIQPIEKMPEILEAIKLALWNAGLSTTPVAGKYYKWLPYLWMLGSMLFVPPHIDYVLRFHPEPAVITQTFYILCGWVLLGALRFRLLWSHMDTVKEIFDGLQRTVNDRE